LPTGFERGVPEFPLPATSGQEGRVLELEYRVRELECRVRELEEQRDPLLLVLLDIEVRAFQT